MRRGSLLVIALMSMVILASAYVDLTIAPTSKDIPVGTIGDFIITLKTSDVGKGELKWKTDDPRVTARINGEGRFKKSGVFSFTNTPDVAQTFILEVQPQDGATLGQPVEIEIDYKGKKGKVKAEVTASVTPVPELSTVVLMSVGLIAMIGLVKMRRRNKR